MSIIIENNTAKIINLSLGRDKVFVRSASKYPEKIIT